MMQLRPHQERILDKVRAALPEHRSVLLYAPPGSGKTVMAAAMAAGVVKRRKRVIFACHRLEIMDQTALTFARFGIQYGFIASGQASNPFASVHIASIDTLRNRYEKHPADLVVVDEAHLFSGEIRRGVINHYREQGAFVVGLSGSPCRLDGKPLKANFNYMVEGPQPAWLIANGYLSDYRAYAPAAYNLAGLHTRAGDYITAELDERFKKPSIIGNAITAWKQHAPGKRTVAYCFSVAHSKEVAASFNAAGVPAEHVDATTPKAGRKRIIADFASGKIMVLCSVELLTTGFDLSAQVGYDVPIEAVSMLRPTQSLALAIQMMGRGLRPKPYPAVLLDHAGIMQTHGLPEMEREWSLDGVSSSSKREGAIPTTICKSCFAVHKPASRCPYCGHQREVDGRKVTEEEGELAEIDVRSLREHYAAIDREHERRLERKQESQCHTLDDWRQLAKERGFAPGWAYHRYNARRKRA